MARKHVYRKGDYVRIVNSRFIRRVGYDLHPDDLRDEMESSERFRDALKALGYQSMNYNRAYRKLLDAVCFAEVHVRGFGSKERKLHYYETSGDIGDLWGFDETRPDATGQVVRVTGKRVAQTGTYFAPWSGRDYEGGYDYEPGGLSNMTSHVLLSTVYGEIEVCDVEPVNALQGPSQGTTEALKGGRDE